MSHLLSNQFYSALRKVWLEMQQAATELEPPAAAANQDLVREPAAREQAPAHAAPVDDRAQRDQLFQLRERHGMGGAAAAAPREEAPHHLDATDEKISEAANQILAELRLDQDKLPQILASLKAYIEHESLLEATGVDRIQKRRAYTASHEGLPEGVKEKVEAAGSRFAASIVLSKKREKILEAREQTVFEGMNPASIDHLYQQCLKELKAIRCFKSKFEEILGNAKLSEEDRGLLTYRVTHSKNSEKPLLIQCDRIMMGYSVYDLLRSQNVIPLDQRTGKPLDYDGQLIFALSIDEIKNVTEHVEQLSLWFEDFGSIVGELLTSNPDEASSYYGTAVKPLSEVKKSPLSMTPRAIQILVREPRGCIVLMNQMTIDLNGHPEKDHVKAIFEGFYRLEDMKSANGLPKTFMIDSPYLSNLNLEQLKKICPHLNKQLVLQRRAFVFFDVDSWQKVQDAIPIYGMDVNQLYNQYKAGLSTQLLTHLKLSSTDIGAVNDQFLAATDVLQAEALSKRICQEEILKRTGITLRARGALFEPNQAQMGALYQAQPLTITVTGGHQLKNIPQLFRALRGSAAVQKLLRENRDYETVLTILEREFERRFVSYHTLPEEGFYGKKLTRNSLDIFEKIVCKIVYMNEYQLRESNVKDGLNAIIGICDQELQNCAEGFCGRIQSVLLALDSNASGATLEDAIVKLYTDAGAASFEKVIRGNSQSSHFGVAQEQAYVFLGKRSSNPPQRFASLHQYAQQAIKDALTQVSSFAVYETAYKWFSDKFWELNKEAKYEEIYALLRELGFEGIKEEIDSKYRVFKDVNRPFQYAFFQQELPEKLTSFLIKNRYLFVKERVGMEPYFRQDQETILAERLPVARAAPAMAAAYARPPVVGPALTQAYAPRPAAAAAARRAPNDERVFGYGTASGYEHDVPSVNHTSG